jgi:hypothetical protein
MAFNLRRITTCSAARRTDLPNASRNLPNKAPGPHTVREVVVVYADDEEEDDDVDGLDVKAFSCTGEPMEADNWDQSAIIDPEKSLRYLLQEIPRKLLYKPCGVKAEMPIWTPTLFTNKGTRPGAVHLRDTLI